MLLIVQEGRDGCLGDDGKVRFYMVCTTATSLYILSLPALEVVFVYSPSSQHHQYYAHSSNNMVRVFFVFFLFFLFFLFVSLYL